MATGNSSIRKQVIAVEIPLRRRHASITKEPLKEIVRENIPDQDPSAVDSISRQRTPEPHHTQATTELENVVLVNVQKTPPRRSVQGKIAVSMSPARPLNVASILAKSPNRPVYRVGLSKRVNVEPLHGYLKKNAS
jgi:hypothetical protein